jgi:hypothetical protein
VPIGSRVPTKNPNRSEVDPQPEPDQASWAKLSITVERSDGGIVDAEIIRPHSWILESGLCAGRMLPLNLPELEVSGLALVTAIDDCPPIAGGEGSVVTARLVTREVHVVASVDVLGAGEKLRDSPRVFSIRNRRIRTRSFFPSSWTWRTLRLCGEFGTLMACPI